MAETIDIDSGLEYAATKLDGKLIGPRTYGWHRKSVGSQVATQDGSTFWLRVQSALEKDFNGRLWDGDTTAPVHDALRRPVIREVFDWSEPDLVWRATLMDLITQPPCSTSPDLQTPVELSETWYLHLISALRTLRKSTTDRVCVRQELIDRRIKERFGVAINTTVSQWVVCHGDLHWKNVTQPQLHILDWEAWGLGVFGLDEAMILAYAGRQSQIALELRSRFEAVLKTRDGLLATLFVCAELLRMIDLHGDHPLLRPSLENLSESTIRTIRLDA